MDLVFEIEKSNIQRVKDKLLADDLVSRASIIFRDGIGIGMGDKYYCYISGSEEVCKRAEEIIYIFGRMLEEKIRNQIIKKIKEEEEKAIEGFGGIFG
ncbi:MAG: hypothetical protein QXY45_04340 [Candidatus Aenigmatarchaeota archaeon]